MDEIRCPMCSKPNPAEEDICRYCEARLRPLQAQPPSEELPVQPSAPFVFPESEERTEWWESDDDDSAQVETELTGDEWIDNLRVESMDHEIEDIDESDWESENGMPSGVEAETSEWLSRIRDHVDGTQFEESQPSESDLEPAKTGVLPGKFSDEEGAEVPLPDWLLVDQEIDKDSSSEEVEQPFEEEFPPSIQEVPDEDAAVESEEIVPHAIDQSTGLTGMLAWLNKQSDESPHPDDDQPVGKLELEEAIQSGEFTTEKDGSDFPEAPGPIVEKPKPDESSQPDWLTELEQKTGLDETSTAGSNDDLKSWPKSDETHDVGTEPQEAPDEQILDWFSSSEEELPDWLVDEGVVGKPGAGPPGDEISRVTGQTVQIDRESFVSEEQDLKDIQDIISALDQKTEAIAQDEQARSEDDLNEDLSWLDELEAAYPDIGDSDVEEVAEAGNQIDEIFPAETGSGIDDDLPDWLAAAAVQDGARDLTSPGSLKDDRSEHDDELPSADLPEWLESMRPVTTVGAAAALVADEVEGEQAGPLAGLKGVLQAEPDITYPQTPPAYSTRLLVTDKQLADAETLRKLIAGEEDTKPIPSAPVITSQYVLRVALFIALSLAVLIPMIFGIPEIGIPASAAASSDAYVLNELVEGISDEDPVLMAIDYEPGFSGEMDVYTGLLLEHLMSKDAFITFVSTSPTGPLLAARLIDSVNLTGNYGYSSPEHFINLGFIPGGLVGLLSFAVVPQETSPFTLDGKDAWQETTLSSISSLSEFAMVVLATENPDTARGWIEQVQPRLGETPFVVVASAQVEPVVRPYYDSNPQQVQALLSGLVTGDRYINLNPSMSQEQAQIYWTPFTLAGLVIVLLFIVGGGVFASVRLFKDRPTGDKGVE